MPSHGLFVARIIHLIAPAANIQLVPVLNQVSIGTMISLANGLQAVYNDLNKNPAPFVINMSLAYPNPRVIAAMFWKMFWNPENENDGGWEKVFGEPMPKLNDAQRASILLQDYPGPLGQPDDGNLSNFAQGIQEMINCSRELIEAAQDFDLKNGKFIASAGNDQTLTRLNSDLPDDLPFPDYPAIDDRVIGVGALDKQGNVTDYTNLADLDTSSPGTYPGIWTFGGDYKYDDISGKSPDPEDGILGEAEKEVSGKFLHLTTIGRVG